MFSCDVCVPHKSVTVMMSLNQLPSISSDMADWKFVRLRNYTELFRNSVFLASQEYR